MKVDPRPRFQHLRATREATPVATTCFYAEPTDKPTYIRVHVGAAFRSPKDTFNRRRALEIAEGRATRQRSSASFVVHTSTPVNDVGLLAEELAVTGDIVDVRATEVRPAEWSGSAKTALRTWDALYMDHTE